MNLILFRAITPTPSFEILLNDHTPYQVTLFVLEGKRLKNIATSAHKVISSIGTILQLKKASMINVLLFSSRGRLCDVVNPD